jgi:ribosomal protein S15P/S13E
MLASLNLGELNRAGEKHSFELSVFQLWYVAVWSVVWDTSDDTIAALVEQALRMFPHITVSPRDEQLRRGREALQELSH